MDEGKPCRKPWLVYTRVVCADTDMLNKQEILDLADYVYQRQIKQIAKALTRVYADTKTLTSTNVPVVITGLGKDFLSPKSRRINMR